MTEAAKRKLRVFEVGCLRQTKGIRRRDRARNEDIRAEFNIGLDVVQKKSKETATLLQPFRPNKDGTNKIP